MSSKRIVVINYPLSLGPLCLLRSYPIGGIIGRLQPITETYDTSHSVSTVVLTSLNLS